MKSGRMMATMSRYAAVKAGLDSLRPHYRHAIELFEANRPIKEMAKDIGVSQARVRQILGHGYKRLEEFLFESERPA